MSRNNGRFGRPPLLRPTTTTAFPSFFCSPLSLPYSCRLPLYGEHNGRPAGMAAGITSPSLPPSLPPSGRSCSEKCLQSRVKNAKCSSLFWEDIEEERNSRGPHCDKQDSFFRFILKCGQKLSCSFKLKVCSSPNNFTSWFHPENSWIPVCDTCDYMLHAMQRVIPLSPELPREAFLSLSLSLSP